MATRATPPKTTTATATTESNQTPSDKFNLNTNEYLNQCDPKDVISFDSEILVSVNKLKKIVQESFSLFAINEVIAFISNHSDFKNSSTWFSQGEECEILRAGSSGWQKGKIKINVTLKFIPDEPEETSPLDDVRKEIDRDNS